MIALLPIVVLDSSVLVPAWSRILLQQLAVPPNARYTPVWSEWIIAETWRTLTWLWIEHTRDLGEPERGRLTYSANLMMEHLLSVMQMASLCNQTPSVAWPSLRDSNDVRVWQTAIVGGARYVVSHNTRDFPPLVDGRHQYEGVEFLATVEFVEDVLGMKVAELLPRAVPPAAAVRSGRVRPTT